MIIIRQILALMLSILVVASNAPHRAQQAPKDYTAASIHLFEDQALQQQQIAFRTFIFRKTTLCWSQLHQAYRDTVDEKFLTVRQVYVTLGLTYTATALSVLVTLLAPRLFGQSPLANVNFDAYVLGINIGLLVYMGLPLLAFLFSQRIIRETLGLVRQAIQLNYQNIHNHAIDADRWIIGDPKPGSYLGSWRRDLATWFFLSHIDFSSYPAPHSATREKIAWLFDAVFLGLYPFQNESMTPINNPYVLRAGARANYIAYRILRTTLLAQIATYLLSMSGPDSFAPMKQICFVLLISGWTALTVANYWLSRLTTPTREIPLYETPENEMRWSFHLDSPVRAPEQRVDRSKTLIAILHRMQKRGIVAGRSIQLDPHGNIEIPIKIQPAEINPMTPSDFAPPHDAAIEQIPDDLHRREILLELSDPSLLPDFLETLKNMNLAKRNSSRPLIESVGSLVLNGKLHYRIVCVGPDGSADPAITKNISSKMVSSYHDEAKSRGLTIAVSVKDFERLKISGNRHPKRRNDIPKASITICDANNLPGNLAQITKLLAAEGLNIDSLRQESSANGVVMEFTVSTQNQGWRLQSTLKRLNSLEFPPEAHRAPGVAFPLKINFFLPDQPGHFNAVARVLADHQLNLKEVLLENADAIRPGHHWAYIEADSPGLDIDELREKLLTLGFIEPDELSIRVKSISRASALAAEQLLGGVTPRNPSRDSIAPDFNEDLGDPDHHIFLKNFRAAIWIAGLAHGNPSMHKYLKRWGGCIPLWLFWPLRVLFPHFYHAWIGPTWFEAAPQGRKTDKHENHLEHTARTTRILLSIGDRDPEGLTVSVLHDCVEDAFKNIWKQYDALLESAAHGRLSWFRRRDSIARMQAVTQFIVSELEFHDSGQEAKDFHDLAIDWEILLTETRLRRVRGNTEDFENKLKNATQKLVETQILSSMRRYGSAVWMGVKEMSIDPNKEISDGSNYRRYVQKIIWRRELYKLRLKFADQIDNLRHPVDKRFQAKTVAKNVAAIVPAALDVISPSYVHKRRTIDEKMVQLYFQTLYEQSLSLDYLPPFDVYDLESLKKDPETLRSNAIDHAHSLLLLLQDQKHPMRLGCLPQPLSHFEELLKEQLADLESGMSWDEIISKSKQRNAESAPTESSPSRVQAGRDIQIAG